MTKKVFRNSKILHFLGVSLKTEMEEIRLLYADGDYSSLVQSENEINS